MICEKTCVEMQLFHRKRLPLIKKHVPMFTSYPITGDNTVETVRYTMPEHTAGKGIVWINQTQYFEGMPSQVWNFCLGNYPVCQKWLLDRIGFSLSDEDIQQYQRIVMVLKEIIDLLVEIQAEIQHSQFKTRKIFEKLQVIVAQQLGIEINQVSLTSNFVKNLGADSLDMMELVMVLESAFNIQINDEFVKDISTVQNLVNYISQNVAI